MSGLSRRSIEKQLDAAALACARDGAELTALRRSVLELVLDAESPPTAYQLLDKLRETRAGAVPPTIYRALDFLLERKLIHKLERLNAFVPCHEPGHHTHPIEFLICRRCGAVAEFEDEGVADALERVAEGAGFRAATAVVEVEGLCAACARKDQAGGGASRLSAS